MTEKLGVSKKGTDFEGGALKLSLSDKKVICLLIYYWLNLVYDIKMSLEIRFIGHLNHVCPAQEDVDVSCS